MNARFRLTNRRCSIWGRYLSTCLTLEADLHSWSWPRSPRPSPPCISVFFQSLTFPVICAPVQRSIPLNCKMRALSLLSMIAIGAFACDDCYGPHDDVLHTRRVRRMQPEAQGAHVKPRGPLEWGQLNFLHTTDTHGWLEGFVDLYCCILFCWT